MTGSTDIRIKIATIRAETPLSSVIGRDVKLIRAGREFKACCPFHHEDSPSFTVNDEKGFFHCFGGGCGAHGDVLDYICRTRHVGLMEAAMMLGSDLIVGPPTNYTHRDPQVRTNVAAPEHDTIADAQAIWRASGGVVDTPAAAYLRWRGIEAPPPEFLRFARLRYGRLGQSYPCLVALVASVDGKLAGIQRTYLREDGTGKANVPKPKLSLGRISGGAIRLAPTAPELIVCEGLEDGLSLQQVLGAPVWVAAGASMLPSMRFPRSTRAIVIGADRDDSGERAALQAAKSFTMEGRSVRIIRPCAPFKDFNAELQGGRIP